MKKRVQNNSEGVRHVNYSKSRAQTQAAIEAEKATAQQGKQQEE